MSIAHPLRAAIDRAKAEVCNENERLILTPEFLLAALIIVTSICQHAPEHEYRIELPSFPWL